MIREITDNDRKKIYEIIKKEFKNITDYYLSLGDGQLNRLMRYLRYEQADKFIKEYKDILYDTKLSWFGKRKQLSYDDAWNVSMFR